MRMDRTLIGLHHVSGEKGKPVPVVFPAGSAIIQEGRPSEIARDGEKIGCFFVIRSGTVFCGRLRPFSPAPDRREYAADPGARRFAAIGVRSYALNEPSRYSFVAQTEVGALAIGSNFAIEMYNDTQVVELAWALVHDSDFSKNLHRAMRTRYEKYGVPDLGRESFDLIVAADREAFLNFSTSLIRALVRRRNRGRSDPSVVTKPIPR